MIVVILLLLFTLLFAGVEEQPAPLPPTPTPVVGEEARVLRVIDGDTIEVALNRRNRRVRYIGINTPERDEPCSNAATAANRRLVGRQTVTLVRGAEETDRYGRLLRYIYVGDVFVNEALVRDGFAENFVWEPNTRFADRFRGLEAEAQAAGRGCHPSGVFDDGNTER
ncbi:MAG: thermonuclease family protein [Anaerolineae bacterium]|nr:thermonuclease family protein [Anaerolineae bacterium]